jgi:hypothetical protein
MRLDCANLFTNYSYEFLNEELWADTDGSQGAYWVEDGIHALVSGPIWFWADNRPAYGYYEHDTSFAPLFGYNYLAKVTWAGNNSWNVYRDSTQIGTSTSNPGPSLRGTSGMEIRYNDDTGQAAARNLSYTPLGGSSHLGWTSSAITWTDGTDNWGSLYSYWQTAYYDNKNGVSYCNTGLNPSAAATATSASSSPPTTSQSANIARSFAAQNGDPSAVVASVGTYRRQAAVASVGGPGTSVDSDQNVNLVVLHGSFVGNDASVPRGAALPVGSVMTVSVDSTTSAIVDWSIGARDPA